MKISVRIHTRGLRRVDKIISDLLSRVNNPGPVIEYIGAYMVRSIKNRIFSSKTDPDGKPVTITPKVWMTSVGTGPSTVSFENQCGRVLFSTYHAEGGEEQALLAQEKALLYILLEVGVCVGKLPPPR